MSDGADHASVPTPAGTREPGDELVSMGMPNIDERDLGRGVDGGERSTGTDETRSGARGHEGEGCEMTKETSRNASIAVGSAEMK